MLFSNQDLKKLIIPLIIEQILVILVGFSDTVMVASVGEAAVSAVSLVDGINVLLINIFSALATGGAVVASQFIGQGSIKKAQYSAKQLILITALLASVLMIIIIIFNSSLLQLIFGHVEANVMKNAEIYFLFSAISYPFIALYNAGAALFRAIGNSKISMINSTIMNVINIGLNAVFIFGLLGAPKMGIAGVALATTIARGIEFGICMLDALHFKVIRFRPAAIFERNKVLFADFMKYSLPAFGNEVSWGLAFSMYSVIMGHLGSDMVAANAVVVVARNLGTVACFGIANAGAILLGKSIGAGRMDTVKSDASKFCRITFVSGIVGGVFIFLLRPLFLNMADLTPTAQGYLNIMLFINMYYVLGQAMNTAVICGVFRSGGDSKWGFICDTIDMWVYAVPMGFLTAFLLKLPPMWVYFIICTDEFVKIPFVYKHYKSYKWIKNITREF